MSKISTLWRMLVNNPSAINAAICDNIRRSRVSHLIPDKLYLKWIYRVHMHKYLDFKNPKEFTAKLQWMKIYDRNPEYITMVDKLAVKEYIAKKIGSEYIIPTLGVWASADEIDFDVLPDKFVLKCNHDSRSVIVCKDKSKLDIGKTRAHLAKCMKTNLFWWGREWPYKGVKPMIFAEQYMEDTSLQELRDYKFFCFGGQCRCFKVDFDRFIEHHANYYDPQGNILQFGEADLPPIYDKQIEMPKNLERMVNIANKLSDVSPFLRVDFYDVDGKIYFGELTFYPASGFGRFTDDKWNLTLGEWLPLPNGGGM